MPGSPTVFYGEGLYYGDGEYYGLYGTGPGGIDKPADLQYFPTDVEGRYTFHWTFEQSFISPALVGLDWELQLDRVPTFNSGDLVTFNKSSAVQFLDGNCCKGFVVDVADRQDQAEQTWYARVRTVDGTSMSVYSDIIYWTIAPWWEEMYAENLLTNLPDNNVYNKDILLELPDNRTTLLYQLIFKNYGRSLDYLAWKGLLTQLDQYLVLARDEALYDNFGVLFDFARPITMASIQYRRCLQGLFRAALTGGTMNAATESILGFTGYAPTIVNIRENMDFVLVAADPDPSLTFLDDSTPSFIVDRSTAAFGVIVQVNNPGVFILDEDLIRFLINKIIPAHVKVFVQF